MSRVYQSGGAQLRYFETGDGVPVVFLHPTPLDHDYWRPLIAEIPSVRAIVPDLRGHGGSELGSDLPVGGFARVPDAPVLSMKQLGRDVLALLDDASVNAAIFVGCSIGGYVLLELWRRAPERVRGLAFICSKPQPDGEAGLARRAATIEKVRSEGVEQFFDTMAQTLPGATVRRERPSVVSEVRARMTLSEGGVVAVQAGLATRPDSVPTVAKIYAPVFALAGGEDGAVSVEEMEAFKATPGDCTFHVLPDAGHLAAYERPDCVAELLTPWLRDVSSR